MNDPRFEELLSRLLDDELSPAELAELIRLAEGDPVRQELLRTQLEAAELIAQAEDGLRDSSLFVAATLDRLDDPFVENVRSALDRQSGSRHGRFLGVRPRWAVAASVAVGVLAVAWFLNRGLSVVAPVDPEVARITAVNGSVQWIGGGGRVDADLRVGRSLGGGTLESLSVDSWAVLEYPDGTAVTVSGLSALTVSAGEPKEMHLRRGRMSADVAPQPAGRPVVIHTPTARLDVLGTQLNVEAGPAATVLNVNEGRVRVTRLVDGSVAEVPADHRAVASVDPRLELTATPRPDPAPVWRSEFPRDARYGEWQPAAGGGSGHLRATALLLTCGRPKPELLFVASAGPSARDASPLVLRSDGRFRIRGRLTSGADVVFGVTLNHPRGGFAGKYVAVRKFDSGPFDWTVPVQDLTPLEKTFPSVKAGLELVDCWSVTLHEDHGLGVQAVELQLADP